MRVETSSRHDVIIIGAGPTGATLAMLCARIGLSVVVIERETGVFPKPRAVHFDDEVMRIFQWAGLAEELEPLLRINPGMRFVDTDGKLLLDWPRPQERGKHGWHTSYRFHQPDLESLLRKHLVARYRDRITFWTGCEALEVDQDDSAATVRFHDTATSEIAEVSAPYVVGCDGGRSLTRSAIDRSKPVPDEDLGFRERWLVVDLLLKRDMHELGDHSIQFCHPTRAATYVRCPENRRRFEFSVEHEDQLPDPDDHDAIWERLSRWLDKNDAGIERSALYTFHSVVAGCWRDRRVLIAGDAAHQTPPFMGQGMCAGIRDAANLAWKLAEAISAGGGDELLDSYESERKPNARAFIEKAVALGKLINASDPKAALEGSMTGSGSGSAIGTSSMRSIYPPLGPGMWAEEGGGQMVSQPRLINRKMLDDEYPYQRVTLTRTVPKNPFGHEQTGSRTTVIHAAEHPQLLALLDDHEAEAITLRPDRQLEQIEPLKKA